MADAVMSAGAKVAVDLLADGRNVQQVKILDGTADSVTPLVVGPNGAQVEVMVLPPVAVASMPGVTVTASPSVTQEQLVAALVALTEQLQQTVRTLSPVSKMRITGAGRIPVDNESTSVVAYNYENIGSSGNYALNVDRPQMSSIRWCIQRARI